MSRETKIGIAVAVSFLCLVGIVVATKLRRNVDAGKEEANTVAKGKPPEAQTNPPVNPAKQSPVVPAEYTPNGANPPPKLLNMSGGNETPVALPVVGANTPMAQEGPPPLVGTPPNQPMTAGPPSLPMADPLKSLDSLIAQQNKQLEIAPPPVAIPDALRTAEKGANDASNKVGNVADNALNKGNEQIKRGVDALNGGMNDVIKQAALPQLPKDTAPVLPAPAAAPNTALPGVPEPMKAETKVPPVPTVPGLAEPAKVETKLPSAPALPDSTKIENKGPSIPGLPAPPVAETKTPAAPSLPGVSLPPITNSNASNNSPNFVIPMPKAGGVKVVDYESKQYMAQPGDTFASLSKAAYGDERLANALLAYNRDFSSNRNMTAPQAGQLILLPPPQVLQQSRYTGAQADARPGIGAAPVSISPPVPVSPMRTFTPATPTADATKSYRVPAAGQLIFELAMQTLGDGNRWAEIYRLNPMIDPLRPIPGNTVVRLPGNANVP